jgi:hypothetical protein
VDIIERTFELIYLKRKVKAQQSIPPAPSLTLSTDRDLLFGVRYNKKKKIIEFYQRQFTS